MSLTRYEVVVVGGGHAAVEAAAAAARMGARTLMAALDLDRIARMSCNPAIGGIGKGHLVREIDALGGVMALATDANGLQFRMLNTGKGPAVRAPRAQADKIAYPRWMRRYLETQVPNLDLAQGMVEGVLTDSRGRACGVEIAGGERVEARAVVLAPGTFLEGTIHVGMESHPGGRWGEPPSVRLAESLRRLGLSTYLLKTGTPARLARGSIRWDALEQQHGDEPPPPFSYMTDRIDRPRIACALTHTNPRTHAIILDALDRSPLYTGKITGIGPRYCPSIETKLVRFADRDSHQVFLEPESLENDLVYVNGVSTSLPADVQDAFLHTIEGLEDVRIVRYGYGIEYLACDPRELEPTLESRVVPGLFLAGQIDGTTGYEEAAGLGLVAGANAVLSIGGEEPLLFRRDEAYLGVMIDDLIAKGAPEPYRLFTSRAEYRLLLRQDNADLRLTAKGREAGLVDDRRWARFERFRDGLEREQERLAQTRIRPDEIPPAALESVGLDPPREALTLGRLLARPEIRYEDLCAWGFGPPGREEGPVSDRIAEQIDIQAAYAGYIERQRRMVERTLSMETFALPREFDYGSVPSLRKEAAQILSERRPATLGQASRLAGVNPADVTAIAIYLHAQRRRQPPHAPRGILSLRTRNF
ncbi:tRNA uridine-5-carboxymethylaminomethyl(34) synthesis enzyme MnmG [Candidatus Sumerlaeota bacterium]|nr:tRNA uridine-5-carboxymethylaminomethyl(34) synthesis enzyme MnmG [Candidatus Sumerlaeota bacterium]